MSLKSTNKVDTNRVQLEIVVSAEEFKKALDTVYARESKKIQIPGFRKGKAPRKYIEKYFGEQVFYEDAVNMIYPNALQAAIDESGIEYVDDKIDFDMDNLSADGFTFKATVTVKPEVEIEGYKGLEITKPAVNVTDEDVDAEVERVRERNSRMVTVEDRAAAMGDTAMIDFEGFVDDVAFDGGKGEGYALALGSGSFIPGFEEQVAGHNIGEEFDVNVTFPEEYQAEELAGKAAVFKCKLHEIKAKELPAVDDEFVKDVSEFDTLDEYKADLKEQLTKAREKAAADTVDSEIVTKLTEMVKAEIPEAMFTNAARDMVNDFGYRLQSQGLDLNTYMKYTGMTEETIAEQFRPQAEQQVKMRLALEKIAALENIVIADEELDGEYQKLADMYNVQLENVKAMIPAKNLKEDVAVERAMTFVRDNAVVTTAE
jgi:trigger factor